ncbi:Glutathione hydrolase 1 proenzyme, partial [Pseudolycoriella hygida]
MTHIIEAKNFKIIENLGRGTFGTVFLCDSSQHRQCCVKAIQIREKNKFRHYNHLELVKREVYLLMHLRHPRILKMFDNFRVENHAFIVTEYIPNGTLLQLIEKRNEQLMRFSEKEILNYFCDILLALEYLQIRGVVHGDLKSENILIDSNSRIKISDFGVSKCIDHSIEMDALCHSTPLNTAPEALFDVTKYTFASDVWSLGCIFYELCMLRHPFHRVVDIYELHQLSSRSIYQTIDYERKSYSRSLMLLSDMMLEPKVEKRGTVNQLIAQPIITVKYYQKSMLQKNGTVIDATISVMFCLGLTSMQSMGIGGGFLMNFFNKKEGRAYTINARERAPILARNESYAAFKFQKNKMFTGPLSIAIPGEVLGYWELHKKFSVMKWKDLIQPTIKLCENGFVLSKHMADSIQLHSDVKNIPNYREMFFNKETGYMPKKPGSIVKPPPSLCSSYKLIAENGGNDFYAGELAALIISDLREIGSIITKEDLELYRIQINESIPIRLTDKDIMYVTPPPSSGLIVSFALNILRKCKLAKEFNNKAVIYHRIIESLKFAFAQRPRLSDPLFEDTQSIVSYLTSFETTDRLSKFVNDEQTYHSQYYNPKFSIKINFGTSHLSIIAPNGDAVFGSGRAGTRTGILFNSAMDDFSYPQQSNYFNLPPSPMNYVKPLKQSVTSMTPIIVTNNFGKVKIVIGAAGGAKIISSALVRVLWLGEDIKQAVDAPRLHHQLLPMILEYEYGNEQVGIEMHETHQNK